ncbi:sulfite exporter TauE/SafE family protein [Martelella alba]|uniref:Probable membrane transporter protein n=1 Tax=Martelella alba TaxID=2590451 RepID=A0A506U011_9HYPH|nr:sulfite exporter TauE/SafE family protein [Martelella alba]TPW27662.1 sulfite exporter TauE/SafE family protein [Martelella alba]
MPLLLTSVFIGAILQRVSGIGFAMVVAPFTIIAIGPAQGVVLVQMCGVASAIIVLTQVVRDVNWKIYLVLLPASAVGIILGTVFVSRFPGAEAEIISALVMLLMLAASVTAGYLKEYPRNAGTLTAAGGLAGAMTVLAGVGGVALTSLKEATRWDQRSFVATLQPYLITLSTGTVIARLAAAPDAWPALSATVWGGIVAVMVVGMLFGAQLSRWMKARHAAQLTLALSLIGALAALADGISKL